MKTTKLLQSLLIMVLGALNVSFLVFRDAGERPSFAGDCQCVVVTMLACAVALILMEQSVPDEDGRRGPDEESKDPDAPPSNQELMERFQHFDSRDIGHHRRRAYDAFTKEKR